MSGHARISRRRLLVLGLAAGLWPLARLGGSVRRAWAPLARTRSEADLGGRLVGLFAHPESARAVGAEYLALHPHEADRRALCAVVAGTLTGGSHGLDSLGDERLRGEIAARIRQDFTIEDVVILRGWILSRTEARLCALAVLA